jgi:hypothetical protein
MLESGVEGLGGRILSETKHVATSDARQAPRAPDEEKAQRPHAPHDIGVGALTGAAPRLGEGVELKAAGDVIGQDAQLLPGTVGAIVARGHDIEGEFALQFRDRLLLRPAASDEGIESRQRQRHVRGDGVVLEVSIVRREQIQLEVLRTLVADVLVVDHHAEPKLPLRDDELVLEAGHAGREGLPVASLRGHLLEGAASSSSRP